MLFNYAVKNSASLSLLVTKIWSVKTLLIIEKKNVTLLLEFSYKEKKNFIALVIGQNNFIMLN